MRTDVSVRARARCIVAVVWSVTRGVLLERERELETVREGLGRARAGEGTLLLIEGPAGVGKTELEREARMAAERAGVMPLDARGSALEQPFAFGVVRQLLEPVISEPLRDSRLFAGAAEPAARLFETDERRSASDDADFRALHSLYWLVVNLADRSPLLVLVDDCQWADPESVRFLAYLAQRVEGLPIAMILAGRPPDPGAGDSTSLWSEMASRRNAVVLYPRPLSASSAIELVRERLGGEADEEFCRACHTATGGNPLFLGELLRGLEAAGIAPSAAAASDVQSVGPTAVSRFVLHRVAALGPAATALARTVAVLGDDTELPLAAQVSGLSGDAARDGADGLVRADIFARGERLGFVHPIVRAALYEDLAPGERHTRHAAVAEALSAAGAPPEQVTAHLLLTTPSGDARRVRTLRAAATGAARRGAPRAAVTRLRRALEESPVEQERVGMLIELGRYELAEMQFEAAEEHLRASLASSADLATRAAAASLLARCTIVSGGQSAEAAADALASLAAEIWAHDADRSLELSSELLMLVTIVPRLRGGLTAQLERFRDQARGHERFEAVARIHAAYEQLVRGASSASVAVHEVQVALATGLPPNAEITAGFLALNVLCLGEHYDAALRLLDFASERARREGHAARQGIIHGQRALIELDRGSLRDAQVEAETGLLLVDERHFVVLQLLAVAIIVHVERGELAEASELVRRGDALGLAEPGTHLAEYLVARSRLRVAQGEERAAAAELLWSGEQLEALGLHWYGDWRVVAAPTLASLGDHETAGRVAREQLELARRMAVPGVLGKSLRAAALACGEEERLGFLEEAVTVLEASQAPLELAHALADLGRELSRRDRRREGREMQRHAIRLADDCGAVALAERARAELQSGPGRPARTELTGRNALTPAEWRVCRQAAEGRSNREIAQALFVTEKTVERHLSSAYHKLEIRSRFQLASAIGN